MDLGAGHGSERRVQFVLLPLSFRSDDDDLIPEKFAGPVIVFPVFGNKNFEHRMRSEARSRGTGKADKTLCQVMGNQFRMPCF